METYARLDFNNAAIKRRERHDDALNSTVELRTTRGLITTRVEHGPLAAPDAIIDMARREAGVEPTEFVRGEIA